VQATWRFNALETPLAASGTFEREVERNSARIFVAGLLLGILSAALLAAVQGVFAHRRRAPDERA
jgi:hypothetical protein